MSIIFLFVFEAVWQTERSLMLVNGYNASAYCICLRLSVSVKDSDWHLYHPLAGLDVFLFLNFVISCFSCPLHLIFNSTCEFLHASLLLLILSNMLVSFASFCRYNCKNEEATAKATSLEGTNLNSVSGNGRGSWDWSLELDLHSIIKHILAGGMTIFHMKIGFYQSTQTSTLLHNLYSVACAC